MHGPEASTMWRDEIFAVGRFVLSSTISTELAILALKSKGTGLGADGNTATVQTTGMRSGAAKLAHGMGTSIPPPALSVTGPKGTDEPTPVGVGLQVPRMTSGPGPR